ncbi:MAG: FAD-dependent oxidoreductase [Nitrospinota bacterium]|nr:FAD-dependent oxidoreductase [Nitrospinota bacterium]
MASKAFDVVVAGAGVIGLSIAYTLKGIEPSLRVAVLGDPMNSLMASRAAAGMLAPFGECRESDRFFQFCRESLDKYPGFIQDLVSVSERPIHFSMMGSIMPASSVGEQWEERLRFFREESIPHEVWTVEQARERAPYLAPECGEVIWVGEGQVNNRQMHDALATGSVYRGVQIINQHVTGFHRYSNRIQAAVTDAGEILGKQFVVAAGSWSQQIGKVLEVSMPLRPIKGQMCRVAVEDGRLDYTIHGMNTYIAPWREGNGFVVGSTMEDRGFNEMVEADVIQGLVDRAAKILPCLKEAPLIESWTGLRPAAEDLMPIMGASGRYENLFYSTGHFRNGILQTPHQADYMAACLLGTLKNPITEFSPDRYDL